MSFEKNEMYLFLVNYSPNRGYFHLVKHSPSSTISFLVKSNREQRRKSEKLRERECTRERSELKTREFKNQKKKSAKQRGRILNLLQKVLGGDKVLPKFCNIFPNHDFLVLYGYDKIIF